MSDYRVLDIDNVARIGLMYIDGDRFEDILLDKLGHTDYNFDNFNAVKKMVMKVEKINPDMNITAVLWQQRIDNENAVVPLVAGHALPVEGWQRSRMNIKMKATFETGESQVLKRNNGTVSHYYALKNSDAETVGVLELLVGTEEDNDL